MFRIMSISRNVQLLINSKIRYIDIDTDIIHYTDTEEYTQGYDVLVHATTCMNFESIL